MFFMQFQNKLNLKKNTVLCIKICKQCTGQSKIDHFRFFLYGGFVKFFLNNFYQHLDLNNDFKHFLHISRVLKGEGEGH